MIVVAEELGYALAPTPLQSTWAAGLLGADSPAGAAPWWSATWPPTRAPPTCSSTGTAAVITGADVEPVAVARSHAPVVPRDRRRALAGRWR